MRQNLKAYYCNRSYLNTLDKYRTYQIDHFFPKTTYPILGVSFYNLVPCCYACNHIKSTGRLSYSPFNPKYTDADTLFKFDYWISGIDYINNEKSINVAIDAADILKGNIKKLELLKTYDLHKKDIQDIIKKSVIFPEEYIDNLSQLYKGLFNTRDEVEHLIFGISNEQKNYRHQILGKLKSDVYRRTIS